MANCKILKEYGTLSEKESGSAVKLTHASWNDRLPKYEIREYGPNGEAWKGRTFSEEELLKLLDILTEMKEKQVIG